MKLSIDLTDDPDERFHEAELLQALIGMVEVMKLSPESSPEKTAVAEKWEAALREATQ